MRTIPEGYSLFQQDLEHVEARLAEDWDSLRGARIFITGGTGFFGLWLVECLLHANDRQKLGLAMTVLSRDPERFLATRAPHLKNRDGLRFIRGSISDIADAGGPYSHIVHAASESNVDNRPNWSARHLESAIEGTRRLLDIAARHRTKAVLLTSSGAVYSQTDRIVGQRCVEGPAGIADYASEKNVYGQAKRMMEIMAAVGAQAHGYRALIARCFAFVGPYLPLDANYAVGNFIGDVLHGRDIVVGGDGTPLRSYLYASDLVVWLLTILVKGKNAYPYNVGSGEAVSIAELARIVSKCAGRSDSVVIKQKPVPGAEPNTYLPDVSRARNDLGLTVNIGLAESIERTLDWHRLRQWPN